MQTNIEGKIPNSNVSLSPDSDLIAALQNILARSRMIIPDLETPYSKLPSANHSNIKRDDSSISAVITERQQQLDAVSHEISDLETIMDSVKNHHQQLVEKKEKIIQSMNFHKGLVSVLWRLPTEVLAQIFHHCLPDFRRWEHAYSWPCLKREAPMVLTRVCRRWRDVVVGIPSLWCKLYLRKHRKWEQAAFCYNLWLKRSRGFPLSLALNCYENDATTLRSLLQPYTNQISSLYIECFQGANAERMWKDLPALQELTIRANRKLPAAPQTVSRLPFTLRNLKLVGQFVGPKRLSSLNPIFAQLTNIELAVHQPNALLHLLQLSPNLSSLTIGIGPGLLRRALQPFTHVKLQSLRIAYVYDCTLPKLFNALSLPNLRMLVAPDSRPWPHEELKALLARSNCPLESLISGNGATTDEQRAEYIALIPSLEVVVDPKYRDYLL
ncbi:uncharacterized protein EDB91DRAFT_1213476 [Suillus paluster]|uniref:uncharacterized protein n=1 Tax=Suillus paluster TaxID=48578 RepID=UPI001B87D5BA|nr:uncharacterized protein EDB91DRAFT_1213476 [Suillus paluster]KAG1756715.1 hypothetical protein EDB91DRAFT_1213476 [Suillus paluster]